MRRVCYLTGTRADFGLMVSTLRLIERHPALELSVLVTGMHLSEQYGMTLREIEAEGFDVLACVPCDMSVTTGAQMARNIGTMLTGFVDALERARPDLLLLLGDRGEMLAGTLAGVHLGIPVVHIHGGERSGTVDEPVRHAISKLAHWHLVATDEARDRLIRMGEHGTHIQVTGAPGLDGLTELASIPREALCRAEGLDPARAIALLVFHPVLHEAESAGTQVRVAAQAILDAGFQVLALMPNSDAGSQSVREVLAMMQKTDCFVVKTHLPRASFVSWMSCCDVMVGNSSSGIIEAASFGTPVINLGTRQNMRERNSNVMDVPVETVALMRALRQTALRKDISRPNRYGDGQAGPKIADFLALVDLSPSLLVKCNAF